MVANVYIIPHVSLFTFRFFRAAVASRAVSCALPAAAAMAAMRMKRSTWISKQHGETRPARRPSLCLLPTGEELAQGLTVK